MHRIERTSTGYEAHYFDSLDAFVDDCETHVPAIMADGSDWKSAITLARKGWQDELANVEQIAANLVNTVEQDTASTHFDTVYDVAGTDVDVCRYLSGEPENMISYPLAEISRAGRVIMLAMSVTYSGGLGVEAQRQRGHIMTAAAIALDRLGLNTEIWADRTILSAEVGRQRQPAISQRIMVKGPNDTIDPARILFATAHRAMLHELCFAHCRYATDFGRETGANAGNPQDPEEFLPDGALYLPTFNSKRDNADTSAEDLRTVLRMAGVID